MKYITKRDIAIITIAGILILIQAISLTNSKIKALAKQDIKIEQLQKEKAKLSPIEELSIKVWNNNRIAEKHLLEIDNLRLQTIEHQGVYEYSLLKKRCYTEQMNRLSQDLESENWFCENDENLENYRGDKKKL